MTRRFISYRVGLIIGLLVLMHFTVRPWLGHPRWGPDFLLLALMIFAVRSRPGAAAVAGFLVGIVSDGLANVAFGAGALSHTVVGYLLAWGKAVFFPDNLMVNAGFFFLGSWFRDLLILLASGQLSALDLILQLVTWSLIMATTTALTGVLLLVVFRDWLRIGTA